MKEVEALQTLEPEETTAEDVSSEDEVQETKEPVETPEQNETTDVAEPEKTAANDELKDDEVETPEQVDFTMIEYIVVYQGREHSGLIFYGEDKVVSHSPMNASKKVLDGIVSRNIDIAHIRVLEVRIPSTDDVVVFFKKSDLWPPDPNVGPYISQEAARIDKRMIKSVVQVERKVGSEKDNQSILTLTLRISGTDADTVTRQLTYFKGKDNLVMTLVPNQKDAIAGAKFSGGFDVAGEGEDKTVISEIGEPVDNTEEPAIGDPIDTTEEPEPSDDAAEDLDASDDVVEGTDEDEDDIE
jgi:hypothetical protein